MAYESITLKEELTINKVISLHYFEYMSDFSFEGESHDFWELLCVDTGAVNVTAGKTTHSLDKGDIIFHEPNEFHDVTANGIIAPNLVVIGFECSSGAMDFFRKKILKIGVKERELLGQIIKEARTAYAMGIDDPYCEKLIRKESIPFGAEQLIKVYLQLVLIQLIRTFQNHNANAFFPKTTKQRSEDELFDKIIAYMEENLGRQLTVEQICHDNLAGRTILQKLFNEHTGCGIIDYFSTMKIDAAKQMIRNQHMNFTQIADNLGYSSIHYFSRQFKKVTGLTPSEYASSIKSLAEK